MTACMQTCQSHFLLEWCESNQGKLFTLLTAVELKSLRTQRSIISNLESGNTAAPKAVKRKEGTACEIHESKKQAISSRVAFSQTLGTTTCLSLDWSWSMRCQEMNNPVFTAAENHIVTGRNMQTFSQVNWYFKDEIYRIVEGDWKVTDMVLSKRTWFIGV